ncbi:hypothetical protein I302_101736 [Kwoniella bestiolae CBS 10118]|uniref:Uncharacterized protein n=1 Tax=Kwoniella bestiolae CBS 10118 TaxID=1296100 RepID=A0A1B9GD26_9TREE|nr:hypothetical protein I302_00412 [Kwoniella bestiolae CBS 10118]OCF28922.1 hypothetical protein I302_00412 [Kwoniella bestiolae CBS 10118]
MTTHLISHQNQYANDMPHTPQQEQYQPQLFGGIPSSSPKMIPTELGSPTKPKNELSKAKRRYSKSLFKWTQELWENTRKDIERRSSTSSSESADQSAQ